MTGALLLLALLAGDEASEPVRYHVTPDLATRSWSVTATVPRETEGDLEFRFSRWTAGSYHLAEYGAFVDSFEASDAAGAELAVTRDGENRFLVAAASEGPVTLRYRARHCAPLEVNARMILDAEGNRIADEYGYLTPNSLLGCVKGEAERPCELELQLPEGWRAAVALPRRDDGVYVAPSWWRLEDSPILFARELRTAVFEVAGIPHEVAVIGESDAATQAIAADCRKIVEAARDWMQELPYPRYVFLLGFVPESQGATGLEHHDSTLMLMTRNPAVRGELHHLIAHEYFHAWCAERIHVQALERPDYSQPIVTGTIWVNEGITEYFCRHLLVSAGLLTRQGFFEALGGSGFNARSMWGMAGERSWTDVSRAASGWRDMQELMAFALKHYEGGSYTMLALDLEMRRLSKGERGIADLVRFLMRAYAGAGRGFGEEEMLAICEGIAQGELDDFFARYIDGPELPDLKPLLDVIGYTTKGGLAKIVPLKQPTAEQEAALADFFTPPPAFRAVQPGASPRSEPARSE